MGQKQNLQLVCNLVLLSEFIGLVDMLLLDHLLLFKTPSVITSLENIITKLIVGKAN